MRMLLQARTGCLRVALVSIWGSLALVCCGRAVAADTADATRQYAAAVALQNRGVFDLAAEEWTKFLKNYQGDSRADRATHYLGVCQLKAGKAADAAATFTKVLKDYPQSAMVEPTYLFLGVAQYTMAQAGKPELYDAAAKTFQTLVTKYPKSKDIPQAMFYQGECLYAQNKKKEAAAAYTALAQKYPDHALLLDALYALGVAQEETGDHQGAGATYDAFLKKFPNSALATEVGMRRGETLFAAGQYDAAAKRFAEAASKEGFALADHATFRQAATLAQLKQYEQAAALYGSMAKKFPKSKYLAAADLAGGKCYYLAGKYDESRKLLGKVLGAGGDAAAEAAHWIARGLLKQRKAADALSTVEKALPAGGAGPWGVQLLMDQADAVYEIPDRRAESVALYASLAGKYPKDALAPQALYMAGFAALGRGDYQAALAHAAAFLSKYPDSELAADVTYVAAESSLQLNQYADAEKRYAELLAKYPKAADAPTWKVRRGLALQLQKKYQETIAALAPALEELGDPQLLAEAKFLIGSSQAELGQTAEAIQSLGGSLDAKPDWRQADETWLVLAHLYRQQKDLKKAIGAVRKLIADFPQSRLLDRAHYRLAEYLYADGDFGRAATEYQQVIEKWPTSEMVPGALYGLGWSLLSQKQYAEAEKVLDQLVAKHPQDKLVPRARYARGMARQQLGRFGPAAEDVQALLSADPTPAEKSDARYVLGLCQVGLKKPAEAAATFQKLLAEDPKYAGTDKVLYELAWAQQSSGQDDAATGTFARLFREFGASPLAPEAAYHVGDHYYKKDDLAKAASAYYASMDKAGNTPLGEKATYKLGWTYFRQDDFENAAKTFAYQEATWPKGPLAADAAFMAAECLFKQGKYKEALAAYGQIAKPANQDFEALALLHSGQAAGQLKQWDKSLELLGECITQFPDSPHLPQAIFEQGQAFYAQKKLDVATKAYESVIAKATNQEVAARAQFMIGEIQIGKKEYKEAIRSFYRVIAGYGYPKWQADAMFEAGRCFKELGLNDKAIEQFRELIQKYPQSDQVQRAQEQIKALGG